MNISDTIIFWTKDTELESLKELLKVSYDFNWRENTFNFPIRGAVTKGKIKVVDGNSESDSGAVHSVHCLYGEGIVRAYEKAEAQLWAGTVIDNIILNEFESIDEAIEFLDPLAIKYNVPYRDNTFLGEEYALRLFKKQPLSEEAYKNISQDIKRVFSQDNKPTSHESVQTKILNTLKFIDVLRLEF